MAAAQNDSDEEITGINVTPLVDIVLVLLIIFMVTANFIVRETKEVDLPKAAKSGETLQGIVNVVLDKEGKLFFDGSEVTKEGLKALIVDAVKKEKEPRAIITADQSLSYGKVMKLIDLVQVQGIAKFALNIQKEASAAPAP